MDNESTIDGRHKQYELLSVHRYIFDEYLVGMNAVKKAIRVMGCGSQAANCG